MQLLLEFWLCFVPLLVAVDAVGLLPVFLALTEGIPAPVKRRIVVQSVLTAMAVALAFLVVGQWVFQLLGITIPDFAIAGGVLLFGFAVRDLLTADRTPQRGDPETVGAVPIGVPLIVGPAVLTTVILLANQHGWLPTVAAIVANVLIAGVVLHYSTVFDRLLGRAGIRTLSKIASLILAAIAVMMIRKGIFGTLELHGLL